MNRPILEPSVSREKPCPKGACCLTKAAQRILLPSCRAGEPHSQRLLQCRPPQHFAPSTVLSGWSHSPVLCQLWSWLVKCLICVSPGCSSLRDRAKSHFKRLFFFLKTCKNLSLKLGNFVRSPESVPFSFRWSKSWVNLSPLEARPAQGRALCVVLFCHPLPLSLPCRSSQLLREFRIHLCPLGFVCLYNLESCTVHVYVRADVQAVPFKWSPTQAWFFTFSNLPLKF